MNCLIDQLTTLSSNLKYLFRLRGRAFPFLTSVITYIKKKCPWWWLQRLYSSFQVSAIRGKNCTQLLCCITFKIHKFQILQFITKFVIATRKINTANITVETRHGPKPFLLHSIVTAFFPREIIIRNQSSVDGIRINLRTGWQRKCVSLSNRGQKFNPWPQGPRPALGSTRHPTQCMLNFKRRIKSHLPFAGIIRS